MTGMTVDPEHLNGLADRQQEAALKAQEAEGEVFHIGTQLWLTHGVFSELSNEAVHHLEAHRRTAGERIAAVCTALAENLSSAAQAYTVVDEQLGPNLNGQLQARAGE